ncbi:MAG: PHP domain-containing protein [Bdellovibrionales bacterium]
MPLCDFHIHSTFSDGEMTIPELVDLYGSRGFGAIAITDHLCETEGLLGLSAWVLDRTLTKQNFSAYLDLIRKEAHRAWKQFGMLVIPGVELTKNSFRHEDSAHIVALGISSYIDPNLSIEKICSLIRSQGEWLLLPILYPRESLSLKLTFFGITAFTFMSYLMLGK